MPDSPPVTSAVLFSSIMVWFLSQNEGLPRLLVPKFLLIRNFNPDAHVLDGEASEPMEDPISITHIALIDGTPRRNLYIGPTLGRAHITVDQIGSASYWESVFTTMKNPVARLKL